MGLLWYFALRSQFEQYQSRFASESSSAPWTIPVVAGLPMAVLVTFLVVVVPLLPDSPREVCVKMLDASGEDRNEFLSEEFRKHRKDVDWITEKIVGDCTLTEGYRFSATEMAKSGFAEGCFVEFEMKHKSKSKVTTSGGFFHLVSQQKRWKIQEMYFTQIAGHEQEGPVPLSQNAEGIRDILEPPEYVVNPTTGARFRRPRLSGFPSSRNSPAPSMNKRNRTNWLAMVLAFFRHGHGKKLLLFLGGLAASAALMWKRFKSRPRG